ncbi:MAG: fumarylacetoacetate hydrolase family protein [Gammaproteobacteria bacterium]|nr:fumarylacetoacetate hydrolase family protein [Gammaproteobacteria bacterium]
MRWLSFVANGGVSFGYVTSDGGVVDVGAKSDFPDLKAAIAADALSSLFDTLGDTADVALDGITYAPTIPNPDKLLCVGLNYKAHQKETGRGGEATPTIFVRFAAAQMGHEQPMVRPVESATLDFEGEIAMIIGKRGRRIARDAALDHVAGFSIYNDGSVREYQRQTSQFTPGKNFASTGGFGPWMMTVDEIGDLDRMEITTRLNGEVMQNATADLLVFGFKELIEYCSTFIELVPGDVIVTGTPGGVGAARNPPVFMDAGDHIEVEVKPIGTLSHDVIVG